MTRKVNFVPLITWLGGMLLAFVGWDWIGYCKEWPVAQRLPFSGLTLELMGLTLVFLNIFGRLEAWEEGHPLKRLYSFLRRLLSLRRDTVVHVGSGELKVQPGSVKVSGTGTVTPPGDLTLQQQIDALRAKVFQMQDEFVKRFERIEERQKKDIAEIKELVARLERTITERIFALESKIKRAHVGDVGMEYVGLGWVGIGLFVATIPDFVASTIRPLFVFEWVGSAYRLVCGV